MAAKVCADKLIKVECDFESSRQTKSRKLLKRQIKHGKKLLIASVIVRGFVACLHVPIFPAIGHITINIPKIFQVLLLVRQIYLQHVTVHKGKTFV